MRVRGLQGDLESCECFDQMENTVIATGGSVVYCDEAMQHLKSEGVVVYLKISLELLSRRLGNLKGRGV